MKEHRVMASFCALLLLFCLDAVAQDYSSTYDVAQAMLADTKPDCAFRPDMKPAEMAAWQQDVSRAMAELMHHPPVPERVEAELIQREQCDGYTRDRYRFSPLPHCTAQFTVLVPAKSAPQPAVMCIPGSGMTMDNVCDTLDQAYCFATRIAKEGFVAVAVENACAGTMRDTTLSGYDYDTPSRILLELGWSWLGYTSYIDRLILQWMRQQQCIRKDRICVAGFSLGTEPLMVMGALDKDIYAFVYNDFLCNTQERAEVLTRGGGQYQRPFPNSIRHLIPGWWRHFNFPDIVASLAPRPVILTEGGMDRDFDLVRRAYELSGHPDRAELHHYAKFAPDSMRTYLERMPRDIDRDTYFRLANVDTRNHYFKSELIIPWLKRVMYVEPLPDPYAWADGSGRSTKRKDWERHRVETKRLFEQYEIGSLPTPSRDSMEAWMDADTLRVRVHERGEVLELSATIIYPTTTAGRGAARYPAVIGIGLPSGSLPPDIFTERGVAMIAFRFGQVMSHTQKRGTEPINRLYPEHGYVGAYRAWPWGVSRIIDGLEMVGKASRIDVSRLAVTGCSFAGKMALFAGAFDERIALTIAQEPGGGGAAAWRVSETLGEVETLGRTNYSWFIESMRQYSDCVGSLPIDHHQLVSLVCPRALLVLGNTDYKWLADESAYVSCRAARTVWEHFGLADRMGFSIEGGHGHCQLPDSQQPEVEAFVDRFLLGKKVDTNVTRADMFADVDWKAWLWK